VQSKRPMLLRLLGSCALAVAACTAVDPTLPPRDSTWVCSSYIAWGPSPAAALHAIADLLTSGAVELVGSGPLLAGSNGHDWYRALIVLAGKPAALAEADARLPQSFGVPEPPIVGAGRAWVMARRPCSGSEDAARSPIASLYILPIGSLALVRDYIDRCYSCPDTEVITCSEFDTGSQPAAPDSEVLLLVGTWEFLDQSMQLLRERGLQPTGFFYCEQWSLFGLGRSMER
jgi:hypothetical protein